MHSHLTEPCKSCDGTGLVARARRRLPNGEPDQLDTLEWPQVICETCNGSGRVPLDHATIVEANPA
jgi:DnaJ-class molecular chaperone